MAKERPRFDRLAPPSQSSETPEQRAEWFRATLIRDLKEKWLAEQLSQPAEPPTNDSKPASTIEEIVIFSGADVDIPSIDGPVLRKPVDKPTEPDLFADRPPVREIFNVPLARSANANGEVNESESEERKNETIGQVFFRSYITKLHKQEVAGCLRVITATKKPNQRKVFRAIMEEWGKVTQVPSQMHVDINKEKVRFLNDPLPAVLQTDENLIAFFAGLWVAAELPTQILVQYPRYPRLASDIAQRFNASDKFPRVSLLSDGKTLRIANYREAIKKVREVLADVLPFIDAVLPATPDRTVQPLGAMELFLRGYVFDDFQILQAPHGNVRIAYNPMSEARKKTFLTVMKEFAEVHDKRAWMRADIPPEKAAFLEVPLEDILSNPESFAVFFTGIWVAKETKSRITLKDHEVEVALLDASERHFGFRFGRIEEKDKRSTIIITNANKVRGALRRVPLVQAIPRVDEVFPPLPAVPRQSNR